MSEPLQVVCPYCHITNRVPPSPAACVRIEQGLRNIGKIGLKLRTEALFKTGFWVCFRWG